ncbi:MAG: M61 family peptidase, partial [Gemmatimonadetes bacterium]|nr:M61 family peptidase [Gemmatimonadota bacterium]NIT87611.1 M61 family peptidase [Gemmatimonadota bacterium]NIU31473.1 M61 family peptidase [Gemmatimonadota bacterium]NIV61825.1 M61 family peptidase [Gemmatimonadota bacterium]NIW64552.1 M61 family peptidase [Gemmatimonadota bacterium]
TAVTGDTAFAADFFDRYVRAGEAPDYPGLLTAAGISVTPARPGEAWLGDPFLRFEENGAVLLATPLLETPLYEAGADRGDRIVSIDGADLTDSEAVEALLAARAPGASVR